MNEHSRSADSLEKWANGKIHEWLRLLSAGKSAQAARLAIDAIREHGKCFAEDIPASLKSYHFGVRVVLNALRDLANIRLIVQDERWLASPRAIELAWRLAHDARDRLSSYSGLDPDFLGHCLNELESIVDRIDERCGPGIYTSWETAFDCMLCSICNSDIRGCDHVPGEWYGEQMCLLRPEGPHPKGIALVEEPRDPRCRIWPWLKRRHENGHVVIEDIPIFIIFTPEGDDDGGRVVETECLFV